MDPDWAPGSRISSPSDYDAKGHRTGASGAQTDRVYATTTKGYYRPQQEATVQAAS
jgi:hypothetical protein